MNEIVNLIRRVTREMISLLHVRLQQEGGHLQTRKRMLIRNQISQHLDHGLPSDHNCEKKCWLFKSPDYDILL